MLLVKVPKCEKEDTLSTGAITENVDGGCFFVILGKVVFNLAKKNLYGSTVIYCITRSHFFHLVTPIFSRMLIIMQFRALTPAPFQLVNIDKQISYSQT